MRRAQAEIIGLVLIVLLIAIGFLLYVHFSITGNGGGAQQSYETTQLGQSFINSLVKSKVMCGDVSYSVEDLVRDVAAGTTKCAAEEALDNFINDSLHATLDPWGINYRLVVVRKVGSSEETIGLANFTNEKLRPAQRCNDPRSKNPMDRTADDSPVTGTGAFVSIRLEQCATANV
jgi:hypothetical protein